jgi:predicted protein tyrosine phosphatase
MNLLLTICRADEVMDLVRDAEQSGSPYDAVISIEHPGAASLTAKQGRAPRLAEEIGEKWRNKQLILVCWDVEHDRFGVPPPDKRIITKAIEFINEHAPAKESLRLIVHCRSGKARSTALGLVLLLHETKLLPEQAVEEIVRIRPVAAPNLAIVRHGDEVLKLDGKLVAAVEADPEITERRQASERARIHQVESRRPSQPVL